MSYLLDTDIVSNPVKKLPSQSLLRRLATIPSDEQFTSSITIGEILYGALRTNRPQTYLARLENEVLPALTIVDFDESAARVYARIRVSLEQRGTRFDEPDLRIAAIALDRKLTLVTGNVRHFERIEGLAIENWLE